MKPDYSPAKPSFVAAAACLEIDRVAGETIAAFKRAGVPAILLKGASFARWLYRGGALRDYGDCDLLVPSWAESAAEEVLAERGFSADPGTGIAEPDAVARNHVWVRGHHVVELHLSLIGIRAAPANVWPVLSQNRETIMIADTPVATLGISARCLHAALHAAQHGRHEAKPLEDLRRALSLTGENEWHEAARLAWELDASPALGAGLRLLAQGRGLVERLDLPQPDVEAALRAASAPSVAFGVERLARSQGTTAKLRILLATVFPRPALLRWWSPLAHRGAVGLALAYVYRAVWLLLNLPRGVAAWRRARSRVGQHKR